MKGCQTSPRFSQDIWKVSSPFSHALLRLIPGDVIKGGGGRVRVRSTADDHPVCSKGIYSSPCYALDCFLQSCLFACVVSERGLCSYGPRHTRTTSISTSTSSASHRLPTYLYNQMLVCHRKTDRSSFSRTHERVFPSINANVKRHLQCLLQACSVKGKQNLAIIYASHASMPITSTC